MMAKVNPDPGVPNLGAEAWLQGQLPLAVISVHSRSVHGIFRPTFDRRTTMGQPSAVILLLAATLLAGCATHYRADRRAAADDRLGAVAANVWYVPGRALICGASALLAGAAMTLTLGQSYEGASQMMHGGCGGPWTVEAEDVREAVADR
jgi:hypothetical protein